ncbi:MAG: hypothetical protein K1X94_10855 [Sandaracinaceae bacterium]|nr:hypothetical protein [Sandaracinaceae bacterium]
MALRTAANWAYLSLGAVCLFWTGCGPSNLGEGVARCRAAADCPADYPYCGSDLHCWSTPDPMDAGPRDASGLADTELPVDTSVDDDTSIDAASSSDTGVAVDASGAIDTGMSIDTGVDTAESRDAARFDAPVLSCRTPAGECDLMLQDCPPGSACVYADPAPETLAETLCAPIVEAGGSEGAPCCAVNSCDPGLFCAGAIETMPGVCSAMGHCAAYCCSSDGCGPGSTCTPFDGRFAGGECVAGTTPCDLVEQTGCEGVPGTACYPDAFADGRCVTSGTVPEGGSCTLNNDCAPGMACFTISAGTPRSICLRICRLIDGASGCPSSGMACTPAGLPAGAGACPPP